MEQIKSTTVLAIIHDNELAIGADGQATMGNAIIVKSNVKKLRKLMNGTILVGFAGSTADCLTLIDRLDEKLQKYSGDMRRSSVELARDWRTDRYLRKLEAMIIVANNKDLLIVSGNGDVLEPDNRIAAIGSGGVYANSAAIALKRHSPHMKAEEMVRSALTIAADTCIYTNHNITIEKLAYPSIA